MSITQKAPGKLFIAGEYAVTESGHFSVVTSVPKYLHVELTPSDYNEIYSTQRPDTFVEWARECGVVVPLGDNVFPIVTKTIETVEWYVSDLGHTLQNFELYITSDLDEGGVKYGLGSSAAVSVATIKAMLVLYGITVDPLVVYKLASIVQLRLGSKGSFGDIAASSFDTLIAYSCFDKAWVKYQLDNYPLCEVIAMTWEKLSVTPLQLPKQTAFLVGWTGSPANTEQLVSDVQHVNRHTVQWGHFLQQSQVCVMKLIEAIQTSDTNGIKVALRDNRQLLKQLSSHIETPQLQTLIELAEKLFYASKTSGAGGGDCGIAFVDDAIYVGKLLQQWRFYGITPLLIIGGEYHNGNFTFHT